MQPIGPGPGWSPERPGAGPRHESTERALSILSEYLGLTADQETQIKTILAEHRKAVRDKLSEVPTLEDNLQQLLESQNPDPAAVGDIVIRIHTIRNEARDSWAATAETIKGVLNPDQVAKLDSLTQSSEEVRVMRAARALGILPPPTDRQPIGAMRGRGRTAGGPPPRN